MDNLPSSSPSKFTSLVEFIANITTAVVIFLVIYFFVAQPHQVEGNSMLPTYFSGDYVLTEKVSLHFTDLEYQNVIVFKYPKNPRLDYIKRVIALPGDTIKIEDGQVIVNGQILNEPYLNTANSTNRSVRAQNGEQPVYTKGHSFLSEGETYRVQEGEYFVMGDNRRESSDSRDWGLVPAHNVVGKVFFRYWPLARLGFVNGAE